MWLNSDNKIFKNLKGQYGSGLSIAKSIGDFEDYENIIAKGSKWIIDEIKASNLKGRGGAGFPTGLKWSFINQADNRPRYLVINGDEGEPGTCKDRYIIQNEPYKIIEGAILACYALYANNCYIYIRGEYMTEINALQKAIDECYANGMLGKDILGGSFSLDIYIHKGAGAYICGEETSLLESLEGKKGQPRSKPPFPALVGLYGLPTVINNIETIAQVPTILRRGADWYNGFGTEKDVGLRLFSITGSVNNPVVFEEQVGLNILDMIDYYAGGVAGGIDNLRAIIPGGISCPILPANKLQGLTHDTDTLRAAKSSPGTGGMMVIDKSLEIVDLFRIITSFYRHESCGQCTPCREGVAVIDKIVLKIQNKSATLEDINNLKRLIGLIVGNTICGFGDAVNMAVGGMLDNFYNELVSAMEHND